MNFGGMKMVISSKEKTKNNEGNLHNAKFMNQHKIPRDYGKLATTLKPCI